MGVVVLGDVDGLELGILDGFKDDGEFVGDKVDGWFIGDCDEG